jgi:hypothetical protein
MSDSIILNEELFFSRVKMEINTKKLREQLDRLSTVKNVPISQLDDSLLEDFTSISRNISDLLGTDGYNLLFKEIQNKFPTSELSVKPGTVAGYFVGCFVPSNFKYGNNCSLACLTGAPQFYDEFDCDSCKKNIYISPTDGDLTKLVSGTEDINTAIVYIQPPFQGFTSEEIQKLKSDGINQLVFSYYDKNQYLTSDIYPVDKIHIRTNKSPIRKIDYTDNIDEKSNRWIYGVLLALLFLFSIYALWRQEIIK